MDNIKPVRCGCGGEAKIRQKYLMGNLPDVYVICENCSIRTREYYSEAEAVIAWNNAMSGISQYFCINTNDYTITNTINPIEDFHPIYDCMVGKERTAKVDELCGKWGKCECGADVFRPNMEGWKYWPYCGSKLEWE